MEHVRYDVDGGVAVITLDRPARANAQTEAALRELDDCWTRADADSGVRVIVLRSEGKHFSAGHDMTDTADETVELVDGKLTVAAYYDWEQRVYFGIAKHWRAIQKPSIASVQGACIGAGLMLCWPCDLIVAADDAFFSDPVARMGICSVEYHAHPFEFGARKAKELLFTGGRLDAHAAERIGMVNRVVPRADLDAETMILAKQIAEMDPFAIRMAKRAVNAAQDAQGFSVALEAAFDMHQLGHARALAETGDDVVLADLTAMKKA